MSRGGGLCPQAPRGERSAEDPLLPGRAGDSHPGGTSRPAQGWHPDYQESTHAALSRVSTWQWPFPKWHTDFCTTYYICLVQSLGRAIA